MAKKHSEPQNRPASEYTGFRTIPSRRTRAFLASREAREKFDKEREDRFKNVRTLEEIQRTEDVKKVQGQEPFRSDYPSDDAGKKAYDSAMQVYFEKLRRAAGVRPKARTSLKSGGMTKKYGYMGGGKVYGQPRKANYKAG